LVTVATMSITACSHIDQPDVSDGSSSDGAKAVALADAERSYSTCATMSIAAWPAETSQSHDTMVNCVVAAREQARSSQWCDFSSEVRVAVIEFIDRQRWTAPRGASNCRAMAGAVSTQSFLRLVTTYAAATDHADGLDDLVHPLRADMRLSVLQLRCRGDLEDSYALSPQVSARLTRGEALLCASISARWATARLSQYWQ
jgi:hypothetical protein